MIDLHLIHDGDVEFIQNKRLSHMARHFGVVFDDRHPKMHRFLDGLESQGLVQDISKGFDRENGEKVDATPHICAEILARYEATR